MTAKGRWAISCLAAVVPVAALDFAGANSPGIRRFLEPFFYLAAGAGTLHSPSSVVYYGAQWLLAVPVLYFLIGLKGRARFASQRR